MTFLALDVGNTRLKWARYEAARPGAELLEQGAVFLENIDKLADDEWRDMPPPTAILGCIVAADAIKLRVAEQMEEWDVLPRWVVSSAHEAGVINGYDHPARLGADRWVAMIGARHRLLARGSSKPCVVVMVGTAVTVEAIDSSGRFLGGIILPGHGIMLRALETTHRGTTSQCSICSATRRFTASAATMQPRMAEGAGMSRHSSSASLSMFSKNTAPCSSSFAPGHAAS